MKPSMKVTSFLLALAMLISAFAVAGCTPISLSKEWAYKTSDNELAIGVYIYSLNIAYSQAQTYAEDQLDDYDSSSSAWLDEKITDDDDNEQVAREWIKDQADKMCLSYLVVDAQLEKEGIDVGQATLDSAEESAETYWNVGPYASYGYVMPYSDTYEPYGVSLDSFAYCTTLYSAKYEALFDGLYGEGGSKEVSDDDLTTYFTENYTSYAYLPVNLYESTTDESGENTTDVALSDSEISAIKEQLDGYKDSLNGGTSFDDIVSAYETAEGTDTDPSTSAVEVLDDSSIGDELKEAIEGLDTGKATTIQVGSDNTAIYYLVYKKDINDSVSTYIDDATQRESVLENMKSDEFDDYIESLGEELDVEKNTSQLDRYSPDMFFVAVEETTTEESSDDSSSDSSDSSSDSSDSSSESSDSSSESSDSSDSGEVSVE